MRSLLQKYRSAPRSRRLLSSLFSPSLTHVHFKCGPASRRARDCSRQLIRISICPMRITYIRPAYFARRPKCSGSAGGTARRSHSQKLSLSGPIKVPMFTQPIERKQSHPSTCHADTLFFTHTKSLKMYQILYNYLMWLQFLDFVLRGAMEVKN